MPNVNPWGVAAVLLTIGSFVVTWNFAKRTSVIVRLAMFSAFVLLSAPAVLYTIYYLHLLPEMAWFYTLRSWTGSEFLAVFIGCAGGSLATFLPNMAMGVPLFGVIAFTAIPYLKPVLAPLEQSDLRNEWKDGVCLQSTASTCGPASISTILAAMGETTSEGEIVREAFTYSGGTEAWYLGRCLRSRGFEPEFEFEDEFDSRGRFPAMIGVRAGAAGHFIAVLSVSDGIVRFADPLVGLEELPIAEFARRNSFTGFRLSVANAAAAL